MAKKIKWTKQQGRAIGEWGRDVFVTASAGTGKTAVLSGRCVSIAAKRGVCPDVWSQLVLTFTDMAAEEMRSRIAAQLRAAMAASEDGEERGHLRRQLLLLGGADISTIHSFCKRLITEYFYEVGLDPSFGVLDGDESRLLKMESLEKTVDWAWEQENLAQGLGELLGRRDLRVNEGFLSQIVEVSNYLDGVVNRDSWYERARALAEEVNPFDGDMGKEQKRMVARRLGEAIERIRYAQRLYRDSGEGGKWADWWDENFVEPVHSFADALEMGGWDEFLVRFGSYKGPSRFSYKPRGMDGHVAEVIAANAKAAKDEFDGLRQLAVLNPEYLDRLAGAVGLQTMVMLELVRRFEQFYGEAKGTINCLDFADLQRYAVKLLCASFDEEGRAVPSETAKALRGRYKYIFVDEYQDINAVQQTILDMLSEGGNVFGVGDAKQSIYSWRGARPAIFLERVDGAVVEPVSSDEGLRVDLNVNFRSDSRILEFVNAVFSKVMTKELCHIEYDESAQLRAGEQDSESAGDGDKIVEVHILDERGRQKEREEAEEDGDDDLAEGTYSGRQRQAALIAQRIKEMVGTREFQILDKQTGQRRDVEYRDIVILMRSVAKKVDFVEVLRLAGLPVSCEATAGYFEATEISDMLCLLCVLDNPRRDIELAAVLRSPLFGVTDTELAKIRLCGRTGDEERSFLDCVVEYSESGDDTALSEKLRGVLERLEGWRTEARRGKLADLIWRVYRETGYLSFVCALPSGMGRRANLLKLHERAIQFEGFASSGGVASLSRFVDFVEKLVESGQDWSAAGPETAAGNTVRVLSVHKSKGLEFPVVFLADLNNRFNMADARGECLVDDEYGLGLKVIDHGRDARATKVKITGGTPVLQDEADARFSSPGFEVIAEKRRDMSLAEEMRILYVAMTRARERLVLVGAQKAKRCREILCNGLLSVGRIAEWQLRSCKSHFEWVLYGLSDSSELAEKFETGLSGRGDGDKLFCAKLYGEGEERRLNSYIEKIRKSKVKGAGKRKVKAGKGTRGAKLPAGLKERLGWRYGYGDAVVLPAKRSVTQWTHRDDEFVQRDYSRVLERRPRALSEGVVEDSVQGRLVGTATHLVLSKLELTERISEDAVRAVLEEKVGEGAITASVGGCVDVGAIVGFFESDVGRVALDKSNTVFREWSFTFAVPAAEWLSETGAVAVGDDETIIVQGIIDMVIETAGRLVIVDFKTDAVSADEVAERAQVYKRQLELYGRAAGAILKQNVAGKWLYFLGPGCAVEI